MTPLGLNNTGNAGHSGQGRSSKHSHSITCARLAVSISLDPLFCVGARLRQRIHRAAVLFRLGKPSLSHLPFFLFLCMPCMPTCLPRCLTSSPTWPASQARRGLVWRNGRARRQLPPLVPRVPRRPRQRVKVMGDARNLHDCKWPLTRAIRL
ncbi:uncharacterized protein BKA78DRAFT_314240, partial [Phyllosticta capitalensis]|uniref:uncharacterized protein n=1 Tax=Phyllosticta capitalensis TaxID=121624 RepID=UPI0031312B27